MSAGSENPFAGQVVAVTGGGGGIGRHYCLALGKEGASVLVAGRGENVHEVASEIIQAGGKAHACKADARDGTAIVYAARNHFGRIDGLIVNAGITRDRSYAKMSGDEWREVVDVHLEGAHACTRAAWPHMLEQRYGRIILTTSPAALYGNFGQANYSAAKGAVIALMRTLALEGASRNILVNAVSPTAGTAMSSDVLGPELSQILAPDLIAPFVLALLHPAATETGAIMETGGGWGALLRWQRSAGRRFAREDCTFAEVMRNWNEIASFDDATIPRDGLDCLTAAVGPEYADAMQRFYAPRGS